MVDEITELKDFGVKNPVPTDCVVPTKYITKDSGRRQEYSTGMKRDLQDGKSNIYLWMPKCVPFNEQLIVRAGYAAQRGADKYGARNFELAETDEELERFKSSALRHMLQWISGEVDEDHAAAVFFNLTAAEMVKYKQKVKNNEKTNTKTSKD